MRGLFANADVFLWLQNDWRSLRSTMTIGQSELILETWPGRSIHFHWFHDPGNPDPDHPSNKALDLVYQDAVLNLDYGQLRRRMQGLVSRMAERELRITTPAGTDLRFCTGAGFHVNDGDASRAKAAAAASPRDREEEIPCGALRTIPLRDTVEGVIALKAGFGYPTMGNGLDVDRWLDHGLRFHFEGGISAGSKPMATRRPSIAPGRPRRATRTGWERWSSAATRCCAGSMAWPFRPIMASAMLSSG